MKKVLVIAAVALMIPVLGLSLVEAQDLVFAIPVAMY